MKLYKNSGELSRFIEDQQEPSWFAGFRRRAYEAFGKAQWPRIQDEEWRRTDISSFDLDALEFGQNTDPQPAPKNAPDGVSAQIEIRNGKLVELSTGGLPGGAQVLDLQGFLRDPAHQAGTDPLCRAIQRGLEKTLESADNKVYLWSLAAAAYGAVVYVPKGVELDDPVQIKLASDAEDRAEFPLLIVVLEDQARATVHLQWTGDAGFLINQSNLFVVGDAANLSYAQTQETGDGVVAFCNGKSLVSRDSKFRHFEAILGAGFVKHRIDSSLLGPGSDLELDGIYFADGERHVDLRTVQHHNSHHAVSNAVYRGAVAEEAHTIYQGLIEVSPGASGTDAYLSNKNLILNDGAQADSIPCLQINTDDVRCSHGSTTGRLRADQVFYLMSRGYSRAEAQEELILAYFQEVLERVHPAIREGITNLLHKQVAAVDIQLGA